MGSASEQVHDPCRELGSAGAVPQHPVAWASHLEARKGAAAALELLSCEWGAGCCWGGCSSGLASCDSVVMLTTTAIQLIGLPRPSGGALPEKCMMLHMLRVVLVQASKRGSGLLPDHHAPAIAQQRRRHLQTPQRCATD